ncbi:MAG: ComEC/Rec2 family competence protein [Alphaproteobacteria bacterium]
MRTGFVTLERPTRLTLWVSAQLGGERRGWVPWLAVALGAGVAAYFALRLEPPLWLGPGMIGAGALLTWQTRRVFPGMMAAAMVLTAAVGFTAAQWRANSVGAPVLERQLFGVMVEGKVVRADPTTGGFRVVVGEPIIDRLAPGVTPALVRIRVRGDRTPPDIGSRIRIRASLLPPPGPSAPGAFDFQRQAWFQQLGAVGFALGQVEVLEPREPGAGSRTITALRQSVFRRVTAVLDGDIGAVAAALIMGQRGSISEEVLSAMRDAGLAHLLAISGLHMGLVAGLLFFAVRGALALVAPLALNWPIKKWAALAALVGVFGYLLMAGAPVPTRRAFVMTGLVLVAVMLDRTAISLRLVAWAAAVVLLLRPESIVGASFQMSFAAVLALVAFYEMAGPRIRTWYGGGGSLRRLALYIAGIGFTTLVAGLATLPFAIHQFNRVAVFGMAANLVAVPLTGLWIMPWAVLALVLMPVGLEALALVPMGWGVDGMLAVAQTVAAWPGAAISVRAMPVAGLAAVVFGGLWLCLMRQSWRWGGLVLLLGGMFTVGQVRAPDVWVNSDGKLVAVRAENGELLLSSGRAGAFTRGVWLRRAGVDQWSTFPKSGPSADGDLVCDGVGCLYRAKGQIVALVRDAAAFADDCRHADVIISRVPVPRDCTGPHTKISPRDLWAGGAHVLWLEPGGARVGNVNDARGQRPWVPLP